MDDDKATVGNLEGMVKDAVTSMTDVTPAPAGELGAAEIPAMEVPTPEKRPAKTLPTGKPVNKAAAKKTVAKKTVKKAAARHLRAGDCRRLATGGNS
jgi:septal ring-binding cell division protein DamX